MIDLHCDLLSYLAGDPERSPHDARCRCSFGQLEQGGITLQVLAAFVETKANSSVFGMRQIQVFKTLSHKLIEFRLAIENASALFEEKGELVWPENLPRILYLSLTWNDENRFGGGAHTTIGLKEEGRWLLEQMNLRDIAVDLSHASDPLAFEILEEIDRKGYKMRVLASHSNARAVLDAPRNLPDTLIREIAARKGLIGINLYRKFLGEPFPHSLMAHVNHFRQLGAGNCLVFGADFFFDEDLPINYRQPIESLYHNEAQNASCYPTLLNFFDPEFRKQIEVENFIRWEKRR